MEPDARWSWGVVALGCRRVGGNWCLSLDRASWRPTRPERSPWGRPAGSGQLGGSAPIEESSPLALRRLSVRSMDAIVLRVRLISGDSLDVTLEDRDAVSEREVIDPCRLHAVRGLRGSALSTRRTTPGSVCEGYRRCGGRTPRRSPVSDAGSPRGAASSVTSRARASAGTQKPPLGGRTPGGGFAYWRRTNVAFRLDGWRGRSRHCEPTPNPQGHAPRAGVGRTRVRAS
jgi:hypothetical protein